MRIGIDKISIYDYECSISPKLKEVVERANGVKEVASIKRELFSMTYNYTLTETDRGLSETCFNKLTFNPNKILRRNNIENSSIQELKEALEKLETLLKKEGIIVDFSNAKIADIEINLNLPINFNEYFEVFLLFAKQHLNYAKGIYSITNAERINEFKYDESLFIPLSKNTTFKIYSKDRESNLPYHLTRLEYCLETSSYKYQCEKYGVDNSLNYLLSSKDFIETLFRERLKKDFIFKMFDYLEKEVKPILESKYKIFKQNNALARQTGRKEARDVYRYLEQYWIFDYTFLIELVERYNSKNKGREIKRIREKYSKHNNLQKLNFILEIIFPH
nr:MAG TPA: hypothetical protein [Caudoviricetes sp.]